MYSKTKKEFILEELSSDVVILMDLDSYIASMMADLLNRSNKIYTYELPINNYQYTIDEIKEILNIDVETMLYKYIESYSRKDNLCFVVVDDNNKKIKAYKLKEDDEESKKLL